MPRQSNLKIKESFFNENSFSSEAFAHVDEKRHVSHEMANRAVLRGPREPKNKHRIPLAGEHDWMKGERCDNQIFFSLPSKRSGLADHCCAKVKKSKEPTPTNSAFF